VSAETLAPYLTFFSNNLSAIVFIAATIDATGVPFPGRFLIITAGALTGDALTAGRVALFAAAGALVGDHALYLLGKAGGDKILSLYCRWTLGSARCVENAQNYFKRFGGLTIVIGRFITGVRIFAAALAGSGALRYRQFAFFDGVGALLWAALFVFLGHVFGGPAARALQEWGGGLLVISLLPVVGGVGYLAYRAWRRRRHGPAQLARRARCEFGGGGGN
jgi:membrane protein DedA with SNARE-associated domain